MSFPYLYLASSSPRRRELLAQLGIAFETLAVSVDEAPRPGETAARYVTRLARAKARAGALALRRDDVLVLGADTAVVIDERILGKPRDAREALEMLQALSGQRHEVFSAIALAGRHQAQAVQRSEVWFRDIGAAERDAYVASGEPMDKAGAYAIQGRGAMFIRQLRGSYSGVMGLPLFELGQLLSDVPDED